MPNPPGPRGLRALGFLGNGSLGGTVEFLQQTSREYGSVSSFRILHKRIYLVDDPGLIQEILVTRQHEFVRDSGATLLRELVGVGLLTREEPVHRERRRVLQSAFHEDQIAAYASIMAAEAERMASEWTDEKPLDIRQEMRRLTLSIVGSTLFGTEFRNEVGDRTPALADVPVLDYTAKVFKEATRLYPPAILFARRPKSRLTLGGYAIARGQSIILSPFITQRNLKYFAEPDNFQPQRWSAAEPKRFAYFPFGAGAKMCIGEPFARLEGILALATLARRWHLHRDGYPKLDVRGGTLPGPQRPVLMQPVARTAARESLKLKAV